MECKAKRTILLELTETEAFAIKSFLECALNEVENIPASYEERAQHLVDLLKVEELIP